MSSDAQTQDDWTGTGPYSGDAGEEPYFRVLSDRKLERIHEGTVEVLETIGIQVEGAEAIEMMGDAGCDVEGDIVKTPRSLIEDALSTAPKKFTVYNREGDPALHLGTPRCYARSGGTTLEFFDIDTQERKLFTLEQARLGITVADALPNVDMVGQNGVVGPGPDMPLEVVNHLEFDIMLNHTTKPLWVLVADGPILED